MGKGFLLAHIFDELTGQTSHDPKGVKMSVRSKVMRDYVAVKCKQKGVDKRLSERTIGHDVGYISLGRISEQQALDESYEM